MRVAVLSDIHANVQALEAVMGDIVEQNCNHVFCLGDIAMAGPQPKEVLEYVMEQDNDTWTVIQGNTDKMIANYGQEVIDFLDERAPLMANALANDVEIIDDAQKAYLANLPPQLSMTIEGTTVLLVHGSPRRNDEDILPNTPLEEVEEIIAGTNESLILCGHTHKPCAYQTNNGQTVVNVGSVGRPMTEVPKACYVIIDFNQGSFEITHRFVTYDNQNAAQIMSGRDFVGADRFSDFLLSPVERHA